MREETATRWRVVAVLAVCVVTVGSLPGLVAAQSGSVGGSIVVEADETVESVEGVAGSVEIYGTVTGDVSVLAGNVEVHGTVEGDVSAAAGSVEVTEEGEVGGDLSAGAGTVLIAGTVGGDLSAGAGTIAIDGTVGGDVAVGSETTTLGDDAAVEGDLRYGGSLEGNTDAVAGEITEDDALGFDPSVVQPLATGIFAVYAFFLNLLLGALLLALFPRFSTGVADRVATRPLRTGLVGLGAVIGIPIVLVLIAITIVGIPITIVGFLLFALLLWIGLIYGRYAVAAWVLGLVGLRNRWLALVVGLLAGGILALIPVVGDLLNLLIVLLGLGALAAGLSAQRRRSGPGTTDERAATGPASD